MAQRKNNPSHKKECKFALPWNETLIELLVWQISRRGDVYMRYSPAGQTATLPQRPEAINP